MNEVPLKTGYTITPCTQHPSKREPENVKQKLGINIAVSNYYRATLQGIHQETRSPIKTDLLGPSMSHVVECRLWPGNGCGHRQGTLRGGPAGSRGGQPTAVRWDLRLDLFHFQAAYGYQPVRA
eukprot:3513703-Amphidinium_carterae.1